MSREYPASLARVINAVDEDVLGPNYKRLAIDIFMLSGENGCILSAEQLATRLGMHSTSTVETMRWELDQYGLVRRAPGRLAWYISPPADCVPKASAKDPEIFACAQRLTEVLRPAVERRLARLRRDGTPGATTDDPATATEPDVPPSPSPSRPVPHDKDSARSRSSPEHIGLIVEEVQEGARMRLRVLQRSAEEPPLPREPPDDDSPPSDDDTPPGEESCG